MEDFITKLGIRELTRKKKPEAKIKLKSAKLSKAEEIEEAAAADAKKKTDEKKDKKKSDKDVSKLSKKQSLVQLNEVSSTTLKTADLIAKYKPRAFLLVRPGGRWSENRVIF